VRDDTCCPNDAPGQNNPRNPSSPDGGTNLRAPLGLTAQIPFLHGLSVACAAHNYFPGAALPAAPVFPARGAPVEPPGPRVARRPDQEGNRFWPRSAGGRGFHGRSLGGRRIRPGSLSPSPSPSSVGAICANLPSISECTFDLFQTAFAFSSCNAV
jgi:hypothetical protein